ncbi:Protein of unknown function DUF58 [Lachnospiraceae bacterium XBB1006]|nr:Protein of unknown function DUF58 [Lachnospiraceae bacterium XBB1006]
MIMLVFVLIVLVGYIEMIGAKRSFKYLHCKSSYNCILAEPEEVVTQTTTVTNSWFLPMMYVRIFENLPAGIKIEESPKWIKQNTNEMMFNLASSFRLHVLPHKKVSVQMHFSFASRGEYKQSEYKIEVGDLLGIRSYVKSEQAQGKIVVMPQNTEDPLAIKTLGGFLGDLSVKRFLYEDPVLTMGFREYSGREPMKSISWTKTAQTGRLYVKQYDHTMETKAVVVLNMDNGTEQELEACFEIVRTVCEKLEKMHVAYEFFTNGALRGYLGELSWLEEGLGNYHFQTLMYALGCAETKSIGTFADLEGRCEKRQKSGASYILVTPPLKDRDKRVLESFREMSEHELCVLVGRGKEENG